MKNAGLLVLSAGLAISPPAMAKPPLEKARPGVQIEPLRIAKVKKVGGRIVLDGPWIPYTGDGFGTRATPINTPFFDCYGHKPALALDCTPGTLCVPSCDSVPDSGGRWYFGTEYHNPNTIEDMQDCACPSSSLISEIDLGFMWAPPSASSCIIIYLPLEEMLNFDVGSGLCDDESSFTDTGGGGIALDYGVLAPSVPFYYYSCVTGVEATGILSPGSDDNGDPAGLADGSYQMIIADSISGTTINLATGPCQPMLWGTSTNGTGPADFRPGHNNDDAYDDDAPTDGTLSNPAECYSYLLGVCPDPLGKMNCFSSLRYAADFNNDGHVGGFDWVGFNRAFEDVGPLPQSAADINGDCFVDGIDLDAFLNEFTGASGDTYYPCPASSGPPSNTQAYLVTGNATGAGWSWILFHDAAGGFFASENLVPGVTAGSPPIDLATAFAASINDYSSTVGCGAAKLTASAELVGPDAYLIITVGGTDPFILGVGAYGIPAWDICTPTCFFNPRLDQVPPSGVDCNSNGVDDAVDIARKTSNDFNQNAVPDECEPFCPADYNQDTFVDGIDYDLFNNDFESTDPQQQINADFNDDGFVDGIDYDLFNLAFENGC